MGPGGRIGSTVAGVAAALVVVLLGVVAVQVVAGGCGPGAVAPPAPPGTVSIDGRAPIVGTVPDDGEAAADLHLTAVERGGHGTHREYGVATDASGATVATVREFPSPRHPRDAADGEPWSIALTAAEADDLRGRIEACRFFDSWGERRPAPPDSSTWTVTIVLGDREGTRSFGGERDFEPVARFLWLLANQARIARDLRRGAWRGVPRDPAPGQEPSILRPAALVPDVVTCIVVTNAEWTAASAAEALVDLVPADAWPALVADVLTRVEGTRRDTVLGCWARKALTPGSADRAATLVPAALAELRADWPRWRDLSDARRGALATYLTLALRQRSLEAMEVARDMIRRLSEDHRPSVPPGLADLGADAVPFAAEALGDASPAVRMSGVALALDLVRLAHPKTPGERALSDTDRDALVARLAADVVPALERLAASAEEPRDLRSAAFRVLDRWNGRDRAAERRAKDAADAERRDAERRAADAARRAANPPAAPAPRGPYSITGRVLGPGDTPLDGMTVIAQRDDGPEGVWRVHGVAVAGADGAYRIEGLTAGPFQVVAVRHDRWSWRDVAGNGSVRDGIRGGMEDADLRFPGGMIRGVLVDARGLPLARRNVAARGLVAPSAAIDPRLSTTGWDETDAAGRFLLLQLVPGPYDLEVPGTGFLRGAPAVFTGPDVRVVEVAAGASIAGRVIDERGDPVSGADVRAASPGAVHPGAGAHCGDDGRFRIDGLDPSLVHAVGASIGPGRRVGAQRGASAERVATGTDDLVLRIDLSPRVEVTVDLHGRTPRYGPRLRLVRVGEGIPKEKEFEGTKLVWLAAPAGTWKVLARVADLDASGDETAVWIEVGTVRAGDPPASFAVPR